MTIDNVSRRIDRTFTATLLAEAGGVPWTCVIMSGSAEAFGTRRAVKVIGAVEGHPIQSSFMPTGDGRHMLPVKAAILRAIGKNVGEQVTVELTQRLS
ncbi:hypothetical protein GCM10023169_40850 [Georgenia halophila]|uniref:DUF1905 domain-containing protein n=1 Tax=Georgenia halophila TaxID=620889 RepID=A0ABP8LR79_9MICO